MVMLSPLSEESAALSLAPTRNDASASGVSWGAILAGAAAAASLSLILLVLGFGLGLSAVSPWANSGATARAMGISTIVWVAFTQLAASGLGGYLAGRLRVKWANVHSDEVYFRDTAHGFLAWAVASLATAAFLSTAVVGAASGGVRAGAAIAQGAASAANIVTKSTPSSTDTVNYFVDSLFRTTQPSAAQPTDNASRVEVVKIFANDLRIGQLGAEDKQYVGQVVARQTGLSQADAEARVADVYARVNKTITDSEVTARQAADTARKAAAHSALWMFVALLCGAFFASLTAMIGGKRRDLVV